MDILSSQYFYTSIIYAQIWYTSIIFGGCIGDNIYSKQILYCDIKENIIKCVWNKLINNLCTYYYQLILYMHVIVYYSYT